MWVTHSLPASPVMVIETFGSVLSTAAAASRPAVVHGSFTCTENNHKADVADFKIY
jgi:hypothetical protein